MHATNPSIEVNTAVNAFVIINAPEKRRIRSVYKQIIVHFTTVPNFNNDTYIARFEVLNDEE